MMTDDHDHDLGHDQWSFTMTMMMMTMTALTLSDRVSNDGFTREEAKRLSAVALSQHKIYWRPLNIKYIVQCKTQA